MSMSSQRQLQPTACSNSRKRRRCETYSSKIEIVQSSYVPENNHYYPEQATTNIISYSNQNEQRLEPYSLLERLYKYDESNDNNNNNKSDCKMYRFFLQLQLNMTSTIKSTKMLRSSHTIVLNNHQRRHRRKHCYSHSFLIFIEILLLVTMFHVPIVVQSAATYSLCYSQLLRADSNGDQVIDTTSDEWTLLIQYLSGGTVTSTAIDTTAFMTSSGISDGSTTISIAAVQDPTTNHLFCQTLYSTILSKQTTIDVSETKCFYATTIGDANRDSYLDRSNEFPRYANQISGNTYGFGITYEQLPVVVQAIFTEFVDDTTTDTINIVGSKSSETITPEQALKLNSLCSNVGIAILATNADPTITVGGSIPVPAPVATTTATNAPIVVPVASAVTTSTPISFAPVGSPPTSATTIGTPEGFVPSYTSTVCYQKIAFADRSRDNALDKDEYYDFINRITDNIFIDQSPSFDTLPEGLRNNFISLAGGSIDGTINVMGSKPGQTPTQEDTDRLNTFCTSTDVAIQGSRVDGGQPPVASTPTSPNTVPTDSPPVASNISYDDCIKSMIIADLSRNSLLDEKEYVRFVSRLDSTIQGAEEFGTLQPSLQSTFAKLATSNGEIDVTGSKPNESPTPEQTAHLEYVCNEVGVALLVKGNTPTIAPTTISSGFVKINNSFYIGNSMQISASTLKAGQQDWEDLNKAYASFVEKSISQVNNPLRRNLRRLPYFHHKEQRELPATIKDLPTLDQIDDTTCPVYVTDEAVNCQIVSASFQVEFVDMSEPVVLNRLTNYTQSTIGTQLNVSLNSINPNSTVHIIGPAEIMQPVDNTKPGGSSKPMEDGDSSGGANAVQIIGALVIFSILLGGPLYYWFSRHRKKIPKVANEEFDKPDRDEEYGVEQAPFKLNDMRGDENDSAKSPGGNDDDSNEISANYDEEADETNEDSPTGNGQNDKSGGKKFNKFRLGKKKDSSIDDDIAILDSSVGPHGDTDDFYNYQFEEPPEMFNHNSNDDDWGRGTWGNSTNQSQNNDDGIGSRASKTSEDDNENTEWSETSKSNSIYGKISEESEADGDNVAQLGGLVDNGQWSGVLQTAAQFQNNLNDSMSSRNSSHKSFLSRKSDNTETSNYDDNPEATTEVPFDDQTLKSDGSTTSEEHRRKELYRRQIEDLVRKTAPDEIGNVKSMMEKFVGREAELINTLQTMNDRLVSQRALKAVHKSKAIVVRDVRDFASGGVESSAVIAAACMINNDEVYDEYHQDEDFDNENSYYEDDGHDEESHPESRRYDDDDGYEYDEEHDRSQNGSYSYDEDGSYEDGEEGDSRYDDEDDHSGRYDDDEVNNGSYDSRLDEDQSQYENEMHSHHDDDEQSQYDDDEQSQYDDDEQSQFDEQEQSQYGDEDQSRYDDEEQSQYDNDEQSQYDDEEQSQYDDEEQSQYDDEERSQYVDDEEELFDEAGDFSIEADRYDNDDDEYSEQCNDSYVLGADDSRLGSANASKSQESKSHSSNSRGNVYDDGDGSYYSDEE